MQHKTLQVHHILVKTVPGISFQLKGLEVAEQDFNLTFRKFQVQWTISMIQQEVLVGIFQLQNRHLLILDLHKEK